MLGVNFNHCVVAWCTCRDIFLRDPASTIRSGVSGASIIYFQSTYHKTRWWWLWKNFCTATMFFRVCIQCYFFLSNVYMCWIWDNCIWEILSSFFIFIVYINSKNLLFVLFASFLNGIFKLLRCNILPIFFSNIESVALRKHLNDCNYILITMVEPKSLTCRITRLANVLLFRFNKENLIQETI